MLRYDFKFTVISLFCTFIMFIFVYNELRKVVNIMLSRKKIVQAKVSDDDFISDEIDDLNDEHIESEDVVNRRLALAECIEKQKMKQRNSSDSSTNIDDDADKIEGTCDMCHKSFWYKPTDKDVVCPNCGSHQMIEELEEIHVTQHNDATFARQEQLSAKAREQQLRRQQMIMTNVEDKWQDTRKEQMSLEPGSADYQEYVEDLKEHNPFKPEDEMHQALEERNEDLVTKIYDKRDNPEVKESDLRVVDSASKIKAREEQQKCSIHTQAVKAALASAVYTESLSDDALANAITTDNPVLYDSSIKPDEYIKAVEDYVMESTH